MKKKMSIKSIIKIVLLLVILIPLAKLGIGIIPKEITLGEPFERGIARFIVTDVQMADTNYVIANDYADDFLTPIAKEDLQLGNHYIQAAYKDEAPVVITMTVENGGKNDYIFKPSNFKIDYDDGNKYYGDGCYARVEGGLAGTWTEFDNIKLEKVTSGPVEVRMVIWVPNIIITDSASLTLDYYNYSYKIR